MRRAIRRPAIEPCRGPAPWLTTFNDMVTLLTVFFVMIFAMSTIDARITNTVGAGMRKALGVLYEGGRTGVKVMDWVEEDGGEPAQLPPQVHKADSQAPRQDAGSGNDLLRLARQEGLGVTATPSGVMLTLQDRLLFVSGRAELRDNGKAVLDRIAAVLRPISGSVRVEGHTDNAPIQTRAFPSNWELSMGRAVNVVKHLAAAGGISGHRLSAVGYAESRPLAPNTGAEGRAGNRRVEIVVELAAVESDPIWPQSPQTLQSTDSVDIPN